jgi:hypothetical protein
MPQVTFHLLPVLQEGEELGDDKNENKVNDSVTVKYVYRDGFMDTSTMTQEKEIEKRQ